MEYTFINHSFSDYPGKISFVAFYTKCNLRCGYCHNWQLISSNNGIVRFKWDVVFDEIKKLKNWIDAVVFSGGEPTLDPHLLKRMRQVKDIGLLTKLDTNGTNVNIIRHLLFEEVVDYIALDLKAPRNLYYDLGANQEQIDSLIELLAILRSCGVEYEIRTTVVPPFVTFDNIQELFQGVSKKAKVFFQLFNPTNAWSKKYREIVPQKEDLTQLKTIGKENGFNVYIRS